MRRAGGVAHGIDSEPQADFTRRFGAEGFTLVARAAGVFVPETRLADWTADAEVAAVLRRLIEERGVPSQ